MASGWVGPLAAVVVLWVFVVLACVPLLAIGHLRDLLSDWPTASLVPNYLLVTGAVVLGHSVVFLSGIVITGGFGGGQLIRWTIGIALGYPLLLLVLVPLGATATGQWEPIQDNLERWGWLALAAVWYAIVTAVSAGFVFFVLFVAFFPG